MKPFEFPLSRNRATGDPDLPISSPEKSPEVLQTQADFIAFAKEFSEKYTQAKSRIYELESQEGEWTDPEAREYQENEDAVRALIKSLEEARGNIEKSLYQAFTKEHQGGNPTLH